MTRCCPVCKTEDVLWNSLEDKFCICLKCDAIGVSVERAKFCTVKVIRAELSAPSSDEVDKVLARVARNIGWLEVLFLYGDNDICKVVVDDMCRVLEELRAHIVALEVENKRLRAALSLALAWLCPDATTEFDGTIEDWEKLAKSALAQTDVKEGEL